MYQKLLVASDPEGLVEQVVPTVVSLVVAGSEVRVVAVEDTRTPETDRRGASEELDRVVDELRAAGVSAEGVVRSSAGHVERELAEVASAWGADLVILGSHRRGDLRSLFVGSVGQALASHTNTPLLFVGSEHAAHAPTLPPSNQRNLLVAVDYDEGSQSAVETAIAISAPGARVHIVHVQTLPGAATIDGYVPQEVIDGEQEQGNYLIEGALQRFVDHGIHASWELFEAAGDIAGEIVRSADAHRSDVIVLGSRRLATPWALIIGSVAHNVIARTHRSVLLAAPHPAPAPIGSDLPATET